MFKVQTFEFSCSENKYRSFSAWNPCPNSDCSHFWRLFGGFTPCRLELFPYMFFVVLGLSFTGAYRCASEIVHICCVANYSIDMWRSRKFFVLDIELVRQARVVGAIAMSYAWMMMIYALINIQPAFITPWLLLNAILLGIDSLICLIDVLKGRLALCLSAVYPKLLLLCTMALVNCVKTVFQNAIEQDMANELRVFGKESIFAKYN